MKHLFICGWIGVLLLAVVSCKESPVEPEPPASVPNVRIDVLPVFDGNVLYIDSTYTTAEGYDVQFTDIKFYLENVRNGGVQLAQAMLFDYDARGTLLYNGSGVASDFGSIEANLGVGPSLNNSDPTAFPNDSWLNITNSQDMYWGWNPGFIFVKVEAKVDTLQDGNAVFDHLVVLHAGLNENLETFALSNINWTSIGDDSHSMSIELDMSEFLESSLHTIDLKTEFSTHSGPGQEALTTKVMQNFKEALTP